MPIKLVIKYKKNLPNNCNLKPTKTIIKYLFSKQEFRLFNVVRRAISRLPTMNLSALCTVTGE